MSGCDNTNEVKVLVDLDRYEELIKREAHYNNIVKAAIRGAKLGWKDGVLDLAMSDVEDYLQVVEADEIRAKLLILETEQKIITIKEDEV